MFWSKSKKNRYTSIPQFCYIKVGFKGVYITRTCFHDDRDHNDWVQMRSLARAYRSEGVIVLFLLAFPKRRRSICSLQNPLVKIF